MIDVSVARQIFKTQCNPSGHFKDDTTICPRRDGCQVKQIPDTPGEFEASLQAINDAAPEPNMEGLLNVHTTVFSASASSSGLNCQPSGAVVRALKDESMGAAGADEAIVIPDDPEATRVYVAVRKAFPHQIQHKKNMHRQIQCIQTITH